MSIANAPHQSPETIVASGRDRRSALESLFAGMNRWLEGDERTLTGRSIRFDAERSSFAETAQALLEAALDLAGEETSVGIVMLDGLIKTDDGFTGWGSLLSGGAMRTRSVPALQSLAVEQDAGGWRLTAILQRSLLVDEPSPDRNHSQF